MININLKNGERLEEKLKNRDLIIADIDGTMAEIEIMNSVKRAIFNFPLEYLFKKEHKIDVLNIYRVYPYVKEFLDMLKADKAVITNNIPFFGNRISKILGFNNAYYWMYEGDRGIMNLISSRQYKKIFLVGNGIKDDILYRKIKSIYPDSLGMWVSTNGNNENFEINLKEKNWKPLLDLTLN
jgi:hypothetical protein